MTLVFLEEKEKKRKSAHASYKPVDILALFEVITETQGIPRGATMKSDHAIHRFLCWLVFYGLMFADFGLCIPYPVHGLGMLFRYRGIGSLRTWEHSLPRQVTRLLMK